MPIASFLFARRFEALACVLVLIAGVRVVSSYARTAQAFDEPCHVAAGIEFLDRHTYLLDPMHPPLARLAIGLPLYVAGERYPVLRADDPSSQDYNVVGNKVIYGDGHFQRNLALARAGVLPFFLLGAFLVWRWALRAGNNKRTALIAVFFYTTTPTILAFSSIAYTDIVAAATQVAAMFAFSLWLETPTRRQTIWLGLSLGLALGAKFTSFLFLPAAFLGMASVWVLKADRGQRLFLTQRLAKVGVACALAAVVLWGCYGFSVRPVDEAIGISPANMPSFQHFPDAMRGALRKVILANPRVPAPEFVHGLGEAWVLNKAKSLSYLLGHLKLGGWWYFFPVALYFKLPLPLLVALVPGVLLAFRWRTEALYPAASLVAILLVTTRVSYQVGTRHVLACVVLIAIVAGLGVSRLWEFASLRPLMISFAAAILLWQCFESARSQSDFLAYFNETAGHDPSRVLVMGCDLDCGQDMYALAAELHARGVTRFSLATWTSADVSSLNLPDYDVPSARSSAEHLTGWIAISSRTLRTGDFLHEGLPPGSFDWLEHYVPVAQVGKTIELYHLAPSSAGSQ